MAGFAVVEGFIDMNIRRANKEDASIVLALIKELAEYEQAPDQVEASEGDLITTLFADDPRVFCDLIEEDGEVAGMALWFLNYSTWQGKHGIYLEDLFVRPEYRGRGYGKALLKHLAAICIDSGYGRLQWWVLDWNTPAIDFYKSIGSEAMDEWTVFRVSGRALDELATT
jgi:GNAT superfamily N-acetyltransferase